MVEVPKREPNQLMLFLNWRIFPTESPSDLDRPMPLDEQFRLFTEAMTEGELTDFNELIGKVSTTFGSGGP